MRVFFKSLASCRARLEQLRQYERYVLALGHTLATSSSAADMIILWTCAFREDYKISSLAKIQQYLESTSAVIIVAGCLYDIDRDSLPPESERLRHIQWKQEAADIREIFGTELNLEDFREPLCEEKLCDDAAAHRRAHPDSTAMFADQFNKMIISHGCDYHCAYCSEKLVFPPYRSHNPERLGEEALRLYQINGEAKFCLMADSLGQYGHDIGLSLPGLLKALRAKAGPLSFALNNLNPTCFAREMADYLALMDQGALYHLNLPIQSASDQLLERMNREYRRKDLERIHEALSRNGFTNHDTHLLVGFPGEAERDIEETIGFLLKYPPRYILISRFMSCKGTAADLLDDKVPEEIAYARIQNIVRAMEGNGVICNYDHSGLSNQRRQRLAQD